MSRLALTNILVGFIVIFIAASAGAFIAWDITTGFVTDKAMLDSWQLTLSRSAHGHFNLFGYLHVLFGLSLPYSKISTKLKVAQTIGLFLGTLAMGPGMVWRSGEVPTMDMSLSAVVIGIMLTIALFSILLHVFGLGLKLAKST